MGKVDERTRLTDDKRLQAKIDKQLETEARWLQKLLFAASKAGEARTKLAALTGDEVVPLIALDDGLEISLDELGEIVRRRVDHLMKGQMYGSG